MRDFKRLKVWEKAHALVLAVYKATAAFPKAEFYGVTSQLRRAFGVSIPTNIAEGCGRGGEAEMARFFQIAAGSASEVEYLLFLSNDLRYVDQAIYGKLAVEVIEVKRMLHSYSTKLNADC